MASLLEFLPRLLSSFPPPQLRGALQYLSSWRYIMPASIAQAPVFFNRGQVEILPHNVELLLGSTMEQPPPNTTNTTPGMVGVCFLFAIALVTYGVRISTKLRPSFDLTMTDYIVSIALVSTESQRVVWAMLISAAAM